MKKTKRNTKIQVILIVVALILGSVFVINKIASGEIYASAVTVCLAGNPDCKGGTTVDSIITNPTCTVAGKKNIICSTCGWTVSANVTIPATGHSNLQYKSDSNGHHDVTCGVCGGAIAGAAPCHLIKTNEISATCVNPGSITKTCSLCGYTTNTVLPATGHDFTGDYHYIASGKHVRKCANTGCRAYSSKMEPCTYQTTEREKENGDKEKIDTCEQCGNEVTTTVHTNWSEWSPLKEEDGGPTCQHGGKEGRMCGNCGDTEERTVDTVSHDYVYKYTSNGKHVQECKWCDSRPSDATAEEECTYQTTIKENENGHNEKVNTCIYCNNVVTTIIHDFTGGGYKSLSNSRHAQKCKWCEDIWPQSVEACTYSDGKCTKCGASKPTTPGGGDPNPTPDPGDGEDTKTELSGITIYKVNDKDMTNVKINTKASELIKTIQDANEGATVTIFNSNNEVVSEDETLATGMRIEVTIGDTKYDITIVVKGDTNGDGKAGLLDIIKMNKHRLNKSQLEGAYLQAADIDGDGKVSLLDIIKLNKFRLNKITEL